MDAQDDKKSVDYKAFTDDQLLRLINHGNENALSELYDRYSRLVYTIAYNTLYEHSLAEEITQDVFIRVWERAGTYLSEQGRVITWLSSITRNRSIDIIRQQKIRPEAYSVSWTELPTFDPPDDQNVEEIVDLNQRQRRVRWAIAQIPKEQRDVLALAYFKGLSHQQIADTLNEPLGTVKTRLRLAMQKLRILLQSEQT